MNSPTSELSVSRRAWIALAVVCLGNFMVVLDSSIVNVALPDIQADLGFSQANLTWVVDSYLITFGSFMLVAGRFGDLIGRRRVFLSGVALFTLASIVCGLAISPGVLIAARFVQGVGGAIAFSVTIALIVGEFPGAKERAKAMSVYTVVAVGGGAVGLLLGGILTELADWHWIFGINVPIGVATLLLGRAYIDENDGIGTRGGVDVLGSVLVTVALMLGVYAIVGSAEEGRGLTHALSWGGASLALLAAFVVFEARSPNPILPLGILRVPGLTGAALVRGLVMAALYAVLFFGTLYFQQVREMGPLAAGMAFLPMTLTVVTLSIGPVARLVMRFGPLRVLLVGLVTLTVGLALLSTVQAGTPYPHIALILVVMGLGAGLSFLPLLTLAMASVPPRDAGIASGITNVSMQIGAALAIAVLDALATHRTTALLGEGHPQVAAQLSGYHLAFGLSAGAVAAGLVLTLSILRRPAQPAGSEPEARTDAQPEPQPA